MPSDSPDDFINYTILRTNEKVRAKYEGITAEMVKNDIVKIITIPNYEGATQTPAEFAVEKFKIKR